ncbi:CHAT domain-containing protein [Amorphoplanes nipponensis]|uniref:CHAT domain-containing protein n=1 Tax=Actinoplanes nipponensis TaxID=135950 RepID=A0A919MPV5_9ACTN|nr:CHAT domain-containing tetratricopeptide repeat protein [Actinoplanes nipponensis]GIE53001.1 hypothetical protein Ani05nite_65350 [Actinoplanes nipponensis]
MLRGNRWRTELSGLVDTTIADPRPGAAQLSAVAAHLEVADVRDTGQAVFAFDELFRLAAHLSATAGPAAVEAALTIAAEHALRAYRRTADPGLVRGLARRLHRQGMVRLSLALLHRGASLDLGPGAGAVSASLLWNALGEARRSLGDLSDAAPAYAKALAALDATPGLYREERSVVLNNLGLLHQALGDPAAAKSFLVRSLDEGGDLMDRHSRATTLDNLGSVEVALADQAGPYRLSDEYVNEGAGRHLRAAEELFDEAQRLYEAELPRSLPDYVVSLLNHVEAAEQMRQPDRLDRLTARAAQLAADPSVPPETRFLAVVTRGRTLFDQGHPAEAVRVLWPCLAELAPALDLKELLPEGFNVLMEAAGAAGHRQLAEQAAAAVVGYDDTLLPWRLAVASERQARHLFGAFRYRTETVLGHCLPSAPAGEAPPWLYELVLRRKGVLAERQGSAWLRARDTGSVDTALLDAVRDLRRQIAELDVGGVDGVSIQAARHRLREAERRLDEAETRLYRAIGSAAPPAGRIVLPDLQNRLGPDTALVDITTMRRPGGSHRYVAFLVRGHGPVRFHELGEVGEVDDRLQDLADALATLPDGPRSLPEPPALFPPGVALPARVVISGTGLWGMAPWCVVRGPGGRPLIDGHTVSSVPSARSLLAVTPPPTAAGPAVVVGDPDFDLDYDRQVPFLLRWSVDRLEHTATEATEVAARLGVQPLLRGDATRAAVLNVRRPRVLHLASHGVFLDAINSLDEQREPREYVMRTAGGAVVTEERVWGSPDAGPTADQRALHRRRVQWLHEVGPAAPVSRSALVFAGCNAWLAGLGTGPEVGTGLLTAGEFALLDLHGTALVVLSACTTGTGAVDYSDGSMLTLRTAALAAGAACCLSSLWEVDDAATATMMSAFYRHVAAGSSPAQALRTAQLAMRANRPDPYYWAGWVVEGS